MSMITMLSHKTQPGLPLPEHIRLQNYFSNSTGLFSRAREACALFPMGLLLSNPNY